MMDETFHLTPLDVRRYEFGKALRGYDPERVNQFREQVAEELERLARLNADLDAKAKGFHEQLRAFRERDKAINDALVSAQQLRGDIRDQADREASLVIREAKAEAERIVDGARSEIRRMEDQLSSLDRSRRAFLAQTRSLVERHLSELTAAEQATTGNNSAAGSSSNNGSSGGAALRDTGAGAPSWMGSIAQE